MPEQHVELGCKLRWLQTVILTPDQTFHCMLNESVHHKALNTAQTADLVDSILLLKYLHKYRLWNQTFMTNQLPSEQTNTAVIFRVLSAQLMPTKV